MDRFTTHTGVGVPLRRSNVDTDQIIPASYLKRVTRTGFEDGLFAAWRNDPTFVLNRPEYAVGSVLVAGPVEATVLGNLLMQARAAGEIGSLDELRTVVRNSTEAEIFDPEPRHDAAWREACAQFLQFD